jgi:hypothetical protein
MERPANDGELVPLGSCSFAGQRFGKTVSAKREELARTIEAGGPLQNTIAFNLPMIGAFQATKDVLLRWHDQLLIVGSNEALSSSSAGTSSAIDSSVLRDDSFITSYKRTGVRYGSFFGSVRPDILPTNTFFNRLVSVPIRFSGTIDSETVALQASLNFEPLDATILQDMSRGYSEADGDIPISSSLGSASVRIGDSKVSQYVSFADQFILNRLVAGLPGLDTSDATQNLRTNFVRYVLRKIGVSDEKVSGPEDSFANQPHQIILLDDQPNAWAPSVAVAVKFQTNEAARTFLCAEPARLQQTVDKRILLNSARAAKRAVPVDKPFTLYKERLTTFIKDSLGDAEWKRYQALYSVDPFLMTISTSNTSRLAEAGCVTQRSEIPIDGKIRNLLFLSPTASKNAKRFYYRIPEIQKLAEERAQAIDATISGMIDVLVDESNFATAADKAKIDLARILALPEQRTAPTPLTASLDDLATQLQSNIQEAAVEVSVRNGFTIANIVKESIRIRNAIDERISDLRDARTSAIRIIASLRVKRETALRFARRIATEVERDDQRIVGFNDEDRRMLFIANNLEVLKRAAEQATASPNEIDPDQAAERIRFYASGDNTVQSYFDLLADASSEESRSWRTAKLDGPILPVGNAYVGLSGRTNGVVVSLSISRRVGRSKTQ